jgi:hypothetical protein
MQDKGEDYKASVKGSWGQIGVDPEVAWEDYKNQAVQASKAFKEAGYHKQVYNRLTECFQMMKTVISGTEWANFFWLRCDEAADPSLQELANCMKKAYDMSTPQILQAGEWHLPYVDQTRTIDGKQEFFIVVNENTQPLPIEDAIKVSCACACAVSFRNVDYGLEKSKEVYERLVGDERKHGSATEHAAQVMEDSWEDYNDGYPLNMPDCPDTWQEGISHVDRYGNLWSGNVRGFIQFRKTIEGENHDSI